MPKHQLYTVPATIAAVRDLQRDLMTRAVAALPTEVSVYGEKGILVLSRDEQATEFTGTWFPHKSANIEPAIDHRPVTLDALHIGNLDAYGADFYPAQELHYALHTHLYETCKNRTPAERVLRAVLALDELVSGGEFCSDDWGPHLDEDPSQFDIDIWNYLEGPAALAHDLSQILESVNKAVVDLTA